jgi:hypothetical protein
MSTERELLKRSLRFMQVVGCSNDDICQLCDEIEAELAKPDPEPVGVFNGHFWLEGNGKLCFQATCFGALPHVGTKLYTSPPARKSLPGQAIVECVPQKLKPIFMGLEDEFFEFARAIENTLQDR